MTIAARGDRPARSGQNKKQACQKAITRQKGGAMQRGVWILAALALSGCMSLDRGAGQVSRFTIGPADNQTQSTIIADLQARRSILPPDSPYARISAPVLAAASRPAEAQLRGARLRAEAASKNWLPKVGPNISLNSLSEIVSQLVVEQMLFDNGHRKAERAFARADVEIAAVTMVEDTNDRILTALGLYLDAMKARDRAVVESRTLADMEQFEWIMAERVRGGVSDSSDLHVLRQKLAEIRSTLAAQQEAEATAFAELNAMSDGPLDDVSGLTDLPLGDPAARSLDVLRAEAEKERDIASARMERAGLLPALTAGGTLGQNGSGIGLNLSSDRLLGLGTGDSLDATETARDAAARRVAQAEEDSARRLNRLHAQLAALSRQEREAQDLAGRAKVNLDLFQRQYKAGQRQVMDVVGVYETFATRQAASIDLKYERARTQLEIARHLGLLAEGSRI